MQGAWARRISWTLVTTLLLPLLTLALSPRPSQAQLTRIPQVAVLDFGSLTGPRAGGILGRQATDAVVVEMTRTGRFDVTPRSQLAQQIQDLGLTLPLDNIGQRKLGQALGVDFVATGDITNISFVENPRRARVTLSVRLTDVVSGELANGAIQSGISPAPAAGFQPDDDTLINQAISNAAFNSVQTINNYTLPEATVLNTRDQFEVILNRGGRDGITTGLEMIVIRGTDRIGKIRVTQVGSTDSVAAIVDQGKGIRPEDRARAIFALPGYSVNAQGEIQRTAVTEREYTPQRRRQRSAIGTILGVAAAVLLAALLFRSKSSTDAVGARVTARAFADPSVLNPLDPTAARVQVDFQQARDVPTQNVMEYQLFRDNTRIAVLGRGQSTFVDTPTLAGAFTYQVPVVTEGRPTDLEEITAAASGMQVGVSHRYAVSVLYTQVNISGGDEEETLYRLTPVGETGALATPTARPEAISPTSEINLGNVRFTLRTPQGANEYIIELATSPNFENKQTLGPFATQFTSAPIQTGVFDLRGRFGNAQQLYFRIGSRNSVDRPGPLEARRVGTPNGDNFIYSDNRSFTVVVGPPPPP